MAPQRKLPVAFWALLFAAIAVALALIVGIALERKNESNLPAATPTPGPAPQETSASAPSAPDTSAAELKCSLSDMTLESAENLKTSRLVGWGLDPYQLTFWIMDRTDPEAPSFKKLTLAGVQDTSAKVEVTSEQKIACEKSQTAGCLYIGESAGGMKVPADEVTDLWLERDLGAAILTQKDSKAASRAIIARVESGKLMFHETLGLCGDSLEASNDGLAFSVQGADEARTLRVFDKTLGSVLNYSSFGTKSYSRIESALHPAVAQYADAGGLKAVNCREARVDGSGPDKLYAFRDVTSPGDALGSTFALIASGRKTFDSDQEVWVLNTLEPEVSVSSKFTKAQLGLTPGDLMWNSPSKLLISSSNFFQTSAKFRELDTLSGAVSASNFKDGWPGPNTRTRENVISKTATLETQPLFIFRDAKKTSGALSIANQTLNLPGTFAPEETPRLLLSKRSENSWLLLYQPTKASGIYASRVTCSR